MVAEAPGTPIAGRRLLRRVLLTAALLALGDALLYVAFPARDFDRDYRAEWWTIPRFVAHVRAWHRAHPDRATIVVLGPSTTWGSSSTRHNTVPARLERMIHARYRTGPLAGAKVFNLSLKAANASSGYYIWNALGGAADGLVFQVHYYTLAGWQTLEMTPELPAVLGQCPNEDQRLTLGGEWRNRDTTLADRASAFLAGHWALYRDRFALREVVYGEERAPAEIANERYENWMQRSGRERRSWVTKRLKADAHEARLEYYRPWPWGTLPWDVANEVSQLVNRLYRFDAKPTNRNLHFIKLLLAETKRQQVPVFGFSAVFNREVVHGSDEWFAGQYRRNMSFVRRVFAAEGYPFYDHNDLPPLTREHFHDLDHLRDIGAAWQADQVMGEWGPFLEQVEARVEARQHRG